MKKDEHKRLRIDNTKKFYNVVFIDLGELAIFTARVIRQFVSPPYEHRELIRQAYVIGNKSVAMVALTGLIMGLVLTMQTQPTLYSLGFSRSYPGW